MEFLSKFSLEVTRAFSTLLRLLEINDILHQTQKLHAKESVGLQDLPALFHQNYNFAYNNFLTYSLHLQLSILVFLYCYNH